MPSDAADGDVKILFTMSAAPEGISNPEQAYSITAADNCITITGFGGAWPLLRRNYA